MVSQAVRSVSKASGPRSIAGGVGARAVGWIVAVFGAGEQDAFDGAVARIPDGQCSGAGRVQAGIAVGVAQPDDPLDGAQPVDGVDRRQFGDDRDRAGSDLFGLGATPRHAAQRVGDLVRRVVLEVRGASRQVQHMGRHDGVVVEDLHHITGGADGDLLADQSPRHRVQRLPGFDVAVRGDAPERVDHRFERSGRQRYQRVAFDRGEHRRRGLAVQTAVLVASVHLGGPPQRVGLHLGQGGEFAAGEERVPNVGHRPLDPGFVLGFSGPRRVDQGAVERGELAVGQVDLRVIQIRARSPRS